MLYNVTQSGRSSYISALMTMPLKRSISNDDIKALKGLLIHTDAPLMTPEEEEPYTKLIC